MNEKVFSSRVLMPIALAIVVLGGIALILMPLLLSARGYPIQSSDHIGTWSWSGPYRDGGAKEAAANAEIARLLKLSGTKGSDSYEIDVSVASEYELLGDGKQAYIHLSRAIAHDPKRALAYFNMGHLMEEMRALYTAQAAYAAAARAEPTNPLYTTAVTEFAARHPSL